MKQRLVQAYCGINQYNRKRQRDEENDKETGRRERKKDTGQGMHDDRTDQVGREAGYLRAREKEPRHKTIARDCKLYSPTEETGLFSRS